jgi:YhcH/YjgK/YiaL family protein
MILDRLDASSLYNSLNPLFEKAFEFLKDPATAELPDGKYPIVGDDLFAVIARAEGKGMDKSRLEAHRKYIDIQYFVEGFDVIGWENISRLDLSKTPYEEENDIQFFDEKTDIWTKVPAGAFAVFFPEDAHAPMASDVPMHKIVMKVKA